jgi:hypothetical protein
MYSVGKMQRSGFLKQVEVEVEVVVVVLKQALQRVTVYVC